MLSVIKWRTSSFLFSTRRTGSLAPGQNMLALLKRLGVLVDFILLSEVNFVDWFLNLALKCSFEVGDLVMLVHGVAWDMVSVQTGAQLVIGVHIDFLLQLTADIFVLFGWAKMFVQFIVGHALFLLFLSSGLFGHFFSQVFVIYLISVFIEFHDQIMFLSNC